MKTRQLWFSALLRPVSYCAVGALKKQCKVGSRQSAGHLELPLQIQAPPVDRVVHDTQLFAPISNQRCQSSSDCRVGQQAA